MPKHDKQHRANLQRPANAEVRANGEPGTARPRVTVTGSGRVDRPADVVHATFVAEGIRATAAEARSVAAATAAEVIASLSRAGVARADLRTAGIDVSPTWEHDGTRSIRTGFTVINRIAATIRDLEQVGAVLDAALGAGATGLDSVEFALADRAPVEAEARVLAVTDARARAETIAAAAQAMLGSLVAIAEGGAVPLARREMRMAALASDSFAPTPVLPGVLEVVVSVTAEWELVLEP